MRFLVLECVAVYKLFIIPWAEYATNPSAAAMKRLAIIELGD